MSRKITRPAAANSDRTMPIERVRESPGSPAMTMLPLEYSTPVDTCISRYVIAAMADPSGKIESTTRVSQP